MSVWRDSHEDPPKVGQKVYYYGPNIGVWVGKYKYKERVIKSKNGHPDVPLCPHIFHGPAGIVDACDAPYWRPYPPKKYEKK